MKSHQASLNCVFCLAWLQSDRWLFIPSLWFKVNGLRSTLEIECHLHDIIFSFFFFDSWGNNRSRLWRCSVCALPHFTAACAFASLWYAGSHEKRHYEMPTVDCCQVAAMKAPREHWALSFLRNALFVKPAHPLLQIDPHHPPALFKTSRGEGPVVLGKVALQWEAKAECWTGLLKVQDLGRLLVDVWGNCALGMQAEMIGRALVWLGQLPDTRGSPLKRKMTFILYISKILTK